MRSTLLVLLLIAAVAWLWSDSLRARERALRACRRACEELDVQLLDQTVVLDGLRLARNGAGRLRPRRIYAFEFSTNGADRHPGSATLLGARVEHVWLEHPAGDTILETGSRPSGGLH